MDLKLIRDIKDCVSPDNDQYKQVCAFRYCDQILDINEWIYVWEHPDSGTEMTICESCHSDFNHSETIADGWIELDADEKYEPWEIVK